MGLLSHARLGAIVKLNRKGGTRRPLWTFRFPPPTRARGGAQLARGSTRAVVNWQGTIAHGVDLIEVDSASPTYNTLKDPVESRCHTLRDGTNRGDGRDGLLNDNTEGGTRNAELIARSS